MILKPDGWPAWLGEEPADEPQLKALLAGQRARGNVRNNDSSLIEQVAAA